MGVECERFKCLTECLSRVDLTICVLECLDRECRGWNALEAVPSNS